MKLTVKTETIKKELQFLGIAVEQETSIPILTHVMMQSSGVGEATIQSSDLDMYCSSVVGCASEGAFKDCMPYAPLMNFIEHEQGETITIEVQSKPVKASISSVNRSLTVNPMSFDNWPKFPERPETYALQMDAEELLGLVNRSAFCMATEQSRYAFNAVLFECKDRAQMVATDGHRLAWAKGRNEWHDVNFSCLLPSRLVNNLKNISVSQKLGIVVHAGFMHLQSGNRQMSVKEVKCQFPNWQAVIRKTGDTPSATVDSKALLSEVDAAWNMLDERSLALRMGFKDGALVLSGSRDGEQKYQSRVTLQQSNGDLNIGFNARYVRDICAHIQGNAAMYFNGPNDAGIFKSKDDDSCLYLVMPMRM